MSRSAAMVMSISVLLVLGVAGLAMAANPGDVVINEIYPNAPTVFDGAEYIELYNTTDSTINLTGWVLSGTEYYGMCGGEKPQRFPAGSSILSGAYVVIVRDVVTADLTGYLDVLGLTPDFEMYDASQYYEVDYPAVPNMILDSLDAAHDDQLRLIPGTSDYSRACGGYNRYEALFLTTSIGGTVIDEMEYRYSSCTVDACTGVGASDNDAFPSYPDEGLSLGRLDTSADTDNSANDFLWEAATPGQQNVNGLPPRIWSLDYSPCVPGASDPVTIDCYAEQISDGVKWVKCHYKQGAADWVTVDMIQDMVVDSLYTVVLPAQPLETQSLFYVQASDTLDVTGIYPADARTDPYRYSVGLTDISAIQQVDIGDDSSYVAGQAKNITGVVTAARGTYFDNQFVVQQSGGGAWSGIHVYDPSSSVPAAVGDLVILSGRVQEYYNLTELYLFTGCYTEVSSGNPVYETLVPTSEINTASIFAESWEGVLVRADAVTVTNGDLGYGEWEINDGSGPCIVDDLAYYAYQPTTGHTIESVWGICDYAYSFYKIQPRGSADIVGALTVSHVRYTPHAPTTTDVVTVSALVSTGFPLDYVYVYYNTDGGAVFDSTLMSAVDDTTYAGDIGPFPVDHTIVDYYVRAKDNSGVSVSTPDAGTYDFRVGKHTIYEIQSTFASDGDSSLFARAEEPVNVSGIVTAAPGEYSDVYFFVQNSYSGAENPGYRGIKVLDFSSTVSVNRGDSVTVSGDVEEYFNESEIVMFFGEAITVHSTGNTVPEAYPQSSATVESEPWEGVLLSARDSEIIAYYSDFPAVWHITNTGNAVDTCRVSDPDYYSYTPVVGTFVDVHGIVMYAYKSYTLNPRDIDDIHDPTWVGVGDEPDAPVKLALAVTPNPMSLSSDVRFALPTSGPASVRVYNIQGQMVETLVDGNIEAGEYSVHWDGTNNVGNKVTSGIYFFKLETGRGSVINKVVVSR